MTTRRESITATPDLVRFALRRDRVKLPMWIGAIGSGMLYAVSALPTVFDAGAAAGPGRSDEFARGDDDVRPRLWP
jgi:putative exporter of polyketide antibiotics